MPTLNIEGRRVRVDDAFLSMSPDEQNKAVDEIGRSLNLMPAASSRAGTEAVPTQAFGANGVPIGGDGNLDQASDLNGGSDGITAPTAVKPPKVTEPQYGGYGMNATAGANTGLYNTLGAPVDLVTGAINLGITGLNAATGSDIGTIDKPFLGSENIADMMGAVDPRLDPKNTVATTPGERLARAAGEGAGYTLAPEAVLAGVAKTGAVAPKLIDTAGKVLGRGESAGSVATNAAIGAASGVGAQIGTNFTPDQYDALSGMAGGLLAGGAATLAGGLPSILKAGTRMVGDYLAPLSEAGRERLATEKFRRNASDIDNVNETLANQPADLVPGSQPTTGQLTGDLGVLGLERGAAVKSPEPHAQRRADQNAARVDALGQIQPNGAPETVVSAIRTRMADIDREADAIVSRAQEDARTRTAALGEGRTPEATGSSLRASLESARDAAKANERALWNAVDPSGTMVLPTNGTRQAAIDIVKNNPKSAKPIAGEEAAILSTAGGYKETMPLSEMTALSSRLKAEMRAEKKLNGETPSYARMSKLAFAIHADLDGAVLRKVEQESQAVARGEMSEEETLVANMRRQVEGWYSGQAAATGTGSITGAGGRSASGPSGRARVSGTAGEEGRGFEATSGDPRLPSNDVGTDFDRAAQERLTGARAATRGRVATFDNPTLRPLRQDTVPNSAVPSRIFFPQAKSFDAIQSYRRAVGDEAALPALRDYAIDRLRKSALRPDGTFDPARVDAFRRSHVDALRASPELDAQIADAGRAGETLGTVVRQQEHARTELQRSALGKLIGSDDPADVTRNVGSIFGRQDAVARMNQLRGQIRGNADAEQGLRKAVMDHIRTQFIGNTEAGTSGIGTMKSDAFQNFIARNGTALRAAGITDYELKTLGMIADDLQRANRSQTAVKNPGGSDTAQNVYAAGKGNEAPSLLQRFLANLPAAAGTAGGFVSGSGGGIIGMLGGGAVGGAMGKTVADMRMAGLQGVDDILNDMLLNPGRARVLLAKVRTPQQEESALKTLGQMYRRAVTTTSIMSVDGEEKPYEGITVDIRPDRRAAGAR